MSRFHTDKRTSHWNSHHKRTDQSCTTGGFYKSPTASQSLNYTTPIDIAWDTSCLNVTNVDIYLYEVKPVATRVHAWQSVYFPPGSYKTTLQPKWWNSTTSVDLQLVIVPLNVAPFLSRFPAGPIFTVTYHPPSTGTPTVADTSHPDSPVTVVKNAPFHRHTSGGKIAAGIIMPLLILSLIFAAYIKMRRQRGKEERKRWSEAIDKRMSTISTAWKPISAAGAQAAIRNSIAVDSNRASAFSFGSIRPISVAAEGGEANIGSRTRTVLPGHSNGTAQLRSSAITTQMMAERVSRVSFAPDVRPSSEGRRTVTSRAFHTAIVPPLPDLQWKILPATPRLEPDGTLSPTQTNGPETLSVEDIQARLAGTETTPRPSVDAVMPALRLMCTGDPTSGAEGEEPELLFSAQSATFPTIPSPTHSPGSAASASAMSTFMPMQPMPANVMSPDDMLRAYAERRAVGNAVVAEGPTVPSPTYAGIGTQGGIRTLYSPTHIQTQVVTDHKQKHTTIGSQYSGFAEEDAYGGAL